MIKSSLAKLLPDSINCFAIKQKAWQDDKILVITPEQRQQLSKIENAILNDIGKHLYERKYVNS